APRARCLKCLRSSTARPRRSLRLLSCHRAVGCPPPPGLTVKRATVSEIPRSGTERPITASVPMISAQTQCRLALCLQLEDLTNAARLQLHHRFAARPMCCPPLETSRETSHLTGRARDRRALALVSSKHHVDRSPAVWTRGRLGRNMRLLAYGSS